MLPCGLSVSRRDCLQLLPAIKHRFDSMKGSWRVRGEDENVRLATADIVPVNVGTSGADGPQWMYVQMNAAGNACNCTGSGLWGYLPNNTGINGYAQNSRSVVSAPRSLVHLPFTVGP